MLRTDLRSRVFQAGYLWLSFVPLKRLSSRVLMFVVQHFSSKEGSNSATEG